MLGTVLHKPGDIRFEEIDAAKIVNPTDAIINIASPLDSRSRESVRGNRIHFLAQISSANPEDALSRLAQGAEIERLGT